MLFNNVWQCLTLFENVPRILESSSHPVHIINTEGKLNPSAFIPFCQIGEYYFGLKIKPFSVPVCTGFEKIIFEGQLCYSLNIGKLKTPKVNGRNGIKLIIDSNKERESISQKLERQTIKQAEKNSYNKVASIRRLLSIR